jgi:leader peptidase (prepilin peptidase) / N-methyltransferase
LRLASEPPETAVVAAEPAAERASLASAWLRPLPVVLMVAVAAVSFARYGATVDGFLAAFCSVVLVVLAAIDLDRRLLPNRIVLPATAIVLVVQLVDDPGRGAELFGAALAAAAFLAFPLAFNPGGMGLGDVKLALLLGVWLGKAVLAALFFSFLAAVPVSLYLLVRHGAAARRRAIPFGPFLAIGAIAVGLWMV